MEEEQEAMSKQMQDETLGKSAVVKEQAGGRVKVKWDKMSV